MTLKQRYETMTDAELDARLEELTKILNYGGKLSWEEAYGEYELITDIKDARYVERNQKSFDAFYEKHIKGKKMEEINPSTLEMYSDWHKDMYGYRPRNF